MSIKSKIYSLVQRMNVNGDTFAFLAADKGWQNLLMDEDYTYGNSARLNGSGSMLPVVIMDVPTRFQPEVLTGGLYRRSNIVMLMFLYKSELDNTPEQLDVILENARNAQRNFHLILEDELGDNIVSYSVGECYELEHVFDIDLSGVVMPLTVEFRNSDPVCLT